MSKEGNSLKDNKILMVDATVFRPLMQKQQKSDRRHQRKKILPKSLGPKRRRKKQKTNRKKERTKYETLWLLLVRQTEKLDRKIEK
jgi:hypothetical protein